jgi:site-specific recombinase XerD
LAPYPAAALAVSRSQSFTASDEARVATGVSAAAAAGLSKSVTVHTLRHSFATHLLEQSVDIRVIQDLLGHRHIKSTVGYARVAINMIRQVQSPLELLNMAATALD